MKYWILVVVLISIVGVYGSTVPIFVRPLHDNVLSPSSSYSYVFNFSSTSDCSDSYFTVSTVIETDDYGLGYAELNVTDLNSSPLSICEYRNSELKNVHNMSIGLFSDLFVVNDIIAGMVNSSDWSNVSITESQVSDLAKYNSSYDVKVDRSGDTMTGDLVVPNVNVSTDIRVTGKSYYTDDIYVYDNMRWDMDSGVDYGKRMTFTEGGSDALYFRPYYGMDQFLIAVGGRVGSHIVMSGTGAWSQDFDHAAQGNPTLYIHSVTAPNTDNTQWMSFAHDQTNAVFGLGTGEYTFPDGNVCIGCSGTGGNKTKIDGDARVTGDLFVDGTLHGGSPLMLEDDVCIRDRVTDEWVKCSSQNYQFVCEPDDYCEKKERVLIDRRANPSKYVECVNKTSSWVERDMVSYSVVETVCEPIDLTKRGINYWHARLGVVKREGI